MVVLSNRLMEDAINVKNVHQVMIYVKIAMEKNIHIINLNIYNIQHYMQVINICLA